MQLHALFGTTASLVGALAVLAWRVRETRRTVTTRTIVLPPLAMSTGLAMFAVPAMRIPPAWGLAALATGAILLAGPMARTSRLERAGDEVVMRRSNGFLAVLLVLVGLRLAFRGYLDTVIPPMRTASLFYLLALGTIGTWRWRMLQDYRRLLRAP